MKDLKQYIYESAELEVIKTSDKNYSVVSLVRRENVDCANISKEDFVKFIKEDINIAVEEYKKICKPYNEEYRKKSIEREVKNAIKYAETKYKREKNRNTYVENARKNAEKKVWLATEPERIRFDFYPTEDETRGIPQDCILNIKSTDKELENCYEYLLETKYFKRGTGWAFKYRSDSADKITIASGRPYVDILLDESSKEEMKRDRENAAKSLERFYSNSNYWGD